MVLISKLGGLNKKYQQFQGEIMCTSDTLGIATQVGNHNCATNLKTVPLGFKKTKRISHIFIYKELCLCFSLVFQYITDFAVPM